MLAREHDMAQVLVRHIGADVVRKLKSRARQHGRSLEGELRAILEQAAAFSPSEVRARVQKVRAMFAGRRFSDSAVLIRRDRQR